MDRAGRVDLQRVSPRLLLRGLLLITVLAGIFGMHVLTADDDAGGHGALSMISTAGHGMAGGPGTATTHDPRVMPAPQMAPVTIATVSADSGSGMTHGGMAACILFLGAAALVLVLLRYRRLTRSTGPGRAALSALTGIRRRGPPVRYRPRIALCVIRT
jgi:hypothetical protein